MWVVLAYHPSALLILGILYFSCAMVLLLVGYQASSFLLPTLVALENGDESRRVMAESKVIITDEEEGSSISELISLCLLGRLHTSNSFNPRAIKTTDFILNEGPWAFDGSILLLKQMIGFEVPSEVEILTIRFWVKAYDVLGKKQTVLTSNIGIFVNYDKATMSSVDKALCFQVDIDISKPLRQGVKFKYVKLLDFCYGCGKLGHILANCDLVQHRNDKVEVLKEKKLFMAFKSKAPFPKVSTKLAFDNPTIIGNSSRSRRSSNMIFDNVLEPSLELPK
ncbi:hypothetical protein Cgig2_017110 [Carnegiea gigantea]|uniref:CCHC-type domain-containing protein n=1 Tax=Carnegiea gigantea TaxID=171969 RepID=A0A9Q1JI18_9CARY|nr:hypothetical protein Cgig2_017110 [Carnegiea gigantea]